MPEWTVSAPWWAFVGIAVTIIVSLVTAARWTGSVDARFKSLEDRMNALDENVRHGFAEIRGDIKRIFLILEEKKPKSISSDSPLRLTALGRKISESLDAPSIASSLAPGLRTRARDKVAYDVQKLCFEFFRDEYKPGAEIDARIKQCAYEDGLETGQVLDVLAIELRDRLLEPPDRPGA